MIQDNKNLQACSNVRESSYYDWPGSTVTSHYLAWLAQLSEKKDPLFEEKYKPLISDLSGNVVENKKDGSFMLSVIVRTQGNRPERLRETLLSLTSQQDDNFEVILIGHKLDSEREAVVRKIIDELPLFMREKVFFHKLDYGNRTTPLNYGFAVSTGTYISLLDDDDIVFDNWVETFHKTADENYGKVIHCYVIAQEWSVVKRDGYPDFLRSVGAPKSTFCRDFDLLEQIRMNHCPPVGLSFPAFYFRKLGIIFDETLTTTEDWDYLMRIAFIAGVVDVRTPTAIYRLWNNTSTSQTEHPEEEWNRNYNRIIQKFKEMPVLIPAGTDKIARYDAPVLTAPDADIEAFFSENKLYFCFGNEDFSESNVLLSEVIADKQRVFFRYDFSETDSSAITAIRFDPCFAGTFQLHKTRFSVQYTDGTASVFRTEDMKFNGYPIDNGLLFCGMDPQMIIHLPSHSNIRTVSVITDAVFDDLDVAVSQAVAHEQRNAVMFMNNYNAVLSSSSWRITRPFRWISRIIKTLIHAIKG